MAPGVYKTFIKHLEANINFLYSLKNNGENPKEKLRDGLKGAVKSIDLDAKAIGELKKFLDGRGIAISDVELKTITEKAYENTRRDTLQAMEGFVHNLNTMHSRGGNQVVFSSVNYGTDTSAEGRMVIRELLRATMNGLGNGEVPGIPHPDIQSQRRRVMER